MRNLLAIGLLAISCSSSDDDTPAYEATRAGYEEFLGDLHDGLCAYDQRCYDTPDYVSVEACLAANAGFGALVEQRKAEAIAAGRVGFVPAVASECVAMFNAACGAHNALEIFTACMDASPGLVAVGGACSAHFECDDVTASLCFDGCDDLNGDEEVQQTGACVAESPVGTPACP